MTIGRIPSVEGGIQPTIFDAKADLLTATANDTPARLAVGANETRLVADSSQATGLKYVADTTNYAIAAKGDLLAGTAADTLTALTVGANNTVLTADSSTATGLKWATPAGVTGITAAAYGSFTSSASGATTVTFPSGRFSSTPSVAAMAAGLFLNRGCTIGNISSTSVDIITWSGSNYVAMNTTWLAVQ